MDGSWPSQALPCILCPLSSMISMKQNISELQLNAHPKKMLIESSVPAGFYFYWIMQLSTSSLLTLPDCLWLATCDVSCRTALFSWTKPNVLPSTVTATVKARSKGQRQSCWMSRMTLILVAGQGPRPKQKPKQQVPTNHLTHNSARHQCEALVPFQKQDISSKIFRLQTWVHSNFDDRTSTVTTNHTSEDYSFFW